jgi:hypothetical protein
MSVHAFRAVLSSQVGATPYIRSPYEAPLPEGAQWQPRRFLRCLGLSGTEVRRWCSELTQLEEEFEDRQEPSPTEVPQERIIEPPDSTDNKQKLPHHRKIFCTLFPISHKRSSGMIPECDLTLGDDVSHESTGGSEIRAGIELIRSVGHLPQHPLSSVYPMAFSTNHLNS